MIPKVLKINRWIAVLGGVFLILVTACGGATITPDTPPVILYGEDVCAQCNMIISDERFAAGLVIEQAPGVFEQRIFDDIGDLLMYEKAHAGELTIAAYYVHDYTSKEWIDGQNAYYIHSKELLTPMGSGLAAVAQQLEAEALAQAWNGTVFTFAELHAEFVTAGATAAHIHHSGK